MFVTMKTESKLASLMLQLGRDHGSRSHYFKHIIMISIIIL